MPGPSPVIPRPPLPVLDLVKASYQAGFSKTAWNMPLMWIAIVLTVLLSWIEYMIPDLAAMGTISSDAPPSFKDMHGADLRHFLEMVMLIVLQLLFLTSLQISWIRYLIRGEKPSGAYLGPAMWQYLGYSIGFVMLVALVVSLTSLPILAAAGGDKETSPVLVALPVFAMMLAGIIWVGTRIVLKFVAVAANEEAMTFATSWQIMNGNVLRWIGGTALALLPFIVISAIAGGLQKLTFGNSLPGRLLWDGLVEGVINVAQVLVCASFAGMAYRFLAPRTGAPAGIVA